MSQLKRIYHADAYDTGLTVGSYWEAVTPPLVRDPVLEFDTICDVAVIGAGFTGLSAALHLTQDFGFAPVVLDSAQVGWGASGRNAGFNLESKGFAGRNLRKPHLQLRKRLHTLASRRREQPCELRSSPQGPRLVAS